MSPPPTAPPPARSRSAVLRELQALLDEAHRLRLAGDHLRGAEIARQALVLAEETGHRSSQALALASLSLNEMRLGETEAAASHGQRALALLRKRRDAAPRIQVLCTMVMACLDMGLAADALAYAAEAIELARAAGDPSLMSWALNRTALVHEAMGDPARGLPLLDEALALARGIDGREEMFSALNNLCSNLIGSSRQLAAEARRDALERALALGAEALVLARDSGNGHREAICESNLSTANVELGRYHEALHHIARQEAISAGRGYRSISVGALSDRAALERHRGNLEASIDFHRQALAAADETDDHARLLEMHRGLYECHKLRGEFEPAIRHLESLRLLEREQLTQQAGRQARLLLNRVELQHAQSAVERARLDAQVQRLRAAALESENARLAVRADELGRSALEDQLTGLANRRLVDTELPARLVQARAQGQPLCIAIADLDHFKRVNDRHGHAIGDEVLRSVARLFMANTRASDLVARMGGEEFLIVLVGTPLAAAHDICERIRLAVAGHAWGRIADKLKVTVSIGLTDGDSESAGDSAGTLDAGALLSQADALLYAAKHAGRNRVTAPPASR